jgi:hypothetical protein
VGSRRTPRRNSHRSQDVRDAACRDLAIGDIAHCPGKLKLILIGFAEAAAAAHAARQHILPGRTFHFEYSTSKSVPSKA